MSFVIILGLLLSYRLYHPYWQKWQQHWKGWSDFVSSDLILKGIDCSIDVNSILSYRFTVMTYLVSLIDCRGLHFLTFEWNLLTVRKLVTIENQLTQYLRCPFFIKRGLRRYYVSLFSFVTNSLTANDTSIDFIHKIYNDK